MSDHPESDHTEIIYSAGQIAEAIMLKQLLSERDIDAVIENQALQGALGELPPGPATNPRLRVAAADAEKAREVVKAFENQGKLSRQRVVEVDEDFNEDWTAWPTCPSCHARRQTVCPICETAGSDLPLAEPNHSGVAPTLGPEKNNGQPELPLVICATCDEPFPPAFYQVCHMCGHEFEDGIASPPAQAPLQRLNPRMWAVACGLGALLAAICGYFWVISR